MALANQKKAEQKKVEQKKVDQKEKSRVKTNASPAFIGPFSKNQRPAHPTPISHIEPLALGRTANSWPFAAPSINIEPPQSDCTGQFILKRPGCDRLPLRPPELVGRNDIPAI
jgi:hypothetical protein